MIMRFPGMRRRALTLSYDDGSVYDKKLVEIMARHGLKGTFNLNSSAFLGKSDADIEDLKNLYLKNGMEVAIHGLVHDFLDFLHAPLCCYEVVKDRENLEKMFGCIVRGMAYAYGSFNNAAVQTLEAAGIVYSRTTVSHERFEIPTDWLRMPATCHHENPRLFELAEKFLADDNYGKPRLFYLWGHSVEYERNNNWDRIEKFASLVGGRSDVWYATNIEIYDYVTAYRALSFSLDGSLVYNPTAFELCFAKNKKEFTVKPGETLRLI